MSKYQGNMTRQARQASPKASHHVARIVAAFEGSLEIVPIIIVAGLVAFAPLAEAGSGIGIAAAFLAAILAGALVGSFADRRGLVAAPSLALALMVSGVLATLIRRGVLAADDAGAAMAVSMLLVFGCGLLMAGLAALGIGRMVPLVPYPVLAGLRNGTAILLVLEQAHEAVGLPAEGYHGMHAGALVVTAVTVAAMVWRLPGLRAVPPIILGLVAGTAAQQALRLLPGGDAMVGPVIGSVLPTLLHPHEVLAGVATLAVVPASALRQVLLPAVLSMTALASLETVACGSALQNETGERSSGRRDLLAVALANVIGGALGALPAAGNLEVTLASARSGAKRSRTTALLRSVLLLAFALLAIPLLIRLPRAVLAGIAIATALHLADLSIMRVLVTASRTAPRHRIEGFTNLIVVLGVAAVAVAYGLVAAVIVGAGLSLLEFAIAMARGPVRRRYAGPLGRSRTRRGDRETEVLLRNRAEIEVIELQGAIFFGSADQVAREIEAALAGGAIYVVLDLGRVHRVDLSGARGLLGTCERLWREDRWLALAAVRPGLPVWDYLSAFGLDSRLRQDRLFPTLEDAIESAETALLASRLGEVQDPVLSGAEALVSLGVPPDLVPALLRRMREIAYPAGASVIHAGDTSRELFVLLEGRADVVLPVQSAHRHAARPAEHSTRIATLASGTLFGEMALLSSSPRSASVVARSAIRCLRLDLDALAVLRSENPDGAWHLLTAIALQIERNLRLADAAIASYEE